jgi:hypothetical protein
VADHGEAAGVGGHHPADRGPVPGGQVHPDGKPGRGGVGLHFGQGRPGPDRDLRRQRVDRAEGVEAPEGEHHLAGQGHAAAHQPGVAALRHDRHAGGGAGPERRRHLAGRPGADHRGGPAPVAPGPVDRVAGGGALVEQHVPGADGGHQLVPERGGQVGHGAMLAR